jgi:hypothetical protein
MSCNCENVHQDAIYGQGRRVFNKTGKDGVSEFRCTVCSTVKNSGVDTTKKKGKK